MSNKLVQQQLKNIIRSLSDQELEKVLSSFELISNAQVEKSCRMISYKCYEATIVCKSRKANGYGRNETEATMNCIKNFLEFIIEEEANIPTVMKALKKEGSETTPTVQTASTTPQATKSPQKIVTTNGYGNAKYGMPPRDLDKANNTLTLNASYAQGLENNNSFDGKGDIEILSKNIGNISMINNSKIYEGNNANNVSQLEMDDLILKLMFEDNKKASLPPNPHASHALKEHYQNSNTHQYQTTSQTYQHSSQTNTHTSTGHYQPSTQSTTQYQQVTVPSLNFEHRSNSVSSSQKLTQGNNENLNVQRSNSRPSVNGAFEEFANQKKLATESSASHYPTHEYNTAHTDAKSEFKYEPKFDVSKYDKFDTKESNTPNSAKMKTSYSNSNIGGGANKSQSQNLSDYNTKDTTAAYHSNNGKCACNCSDQLQKANIKIENLEKKIKLLLEENKILKYLATDPKEKEKENKPEYKPLEYKTEAKPEPKLETINSIPQLTQTKSLFEKSVANTEFHTVPDTYDDFEIPEKNSVSNLTEKSRSMSVDAYAKRKSLMEGNGNASNNKENNAPEPKKDIKKMIPRLRLEMLPNYHANNSKASQQPALQAQNTSSTNNVLTVQNPNLTKSIQGSSNTQIQNFMKGTSQQSLTNTLQNMNVNTLLYTQNTVSGSSLNNKYMKK